LATLLSRCALCMTPALIFLLITVSVDPAVQQKRFLTIAAVGDVMMGTTFPAEKLPPHDGQHLFREVRKSLRGADVVFGNLEGPLIDGGITDKCAGREESAVCYTFRTPTRYVAHLAEAGFNVVSTANNHILDFGLEGERSTRATLRGAFVQPAGGKDVARIRVAGKRVALVGFSFSKNGSSFPSVLDINGMRRVVKKLKAENDILIVSFHAGPEGTDALHIGDGAEFHEGERRGETKRFAHEAVDAGADLLIGHGPHVVRGFELYKNKLIAYSLGNFATYRGINTQGLSGISLILHAELDLETGNLVWGRVVPVRLRNGGIPFKDQKQAALHLIRTLSSEDFSEQNLRFDNTGAFYASPLLQNIRAYFSPSGY